MKSLKYVAALAAVGALGFAGTACAQGYDNNDDTTVVETQPTTVIVTNHPAPFYRKHEISVDGFGLLTLGERVLNHVSGKRAVDNGRLGAGAGVNLFFTKYVGIGADAWSENTTGRFIDNVSGSLILRWPIKDTGLSPYIFGGGGYELESTAQGSGHIGGGLEFRFNPHIGVFVDARYVLAAKTDNYGLGRAGVRLSF